LAGSVGCLGFAAHAAWVVSRSSRRDSQNLLALGLMAFSVGVAFLVGLNRFHFEGASQATRFSTPSTIFWIGAALAVASAWSRSAPSGWQRLAGVGLVFGVSGVMLLALNDSHRQMQHHRAVHERTSTMHLVDVRWDRLAQDGMTPDPGRVYRVVNHLRAERLSFFDTERADLVGATVESRFTRLRARRCRGFVARVERLQTRGRSAARVTGRAWDRIADEPASGIVVADSAGIIRGLGFARPLNIGPNGRSSLDFLRFSQTRGDLWEGFVGVYDPDEKYTAYAIIADRGACPLLNRSSNAWEVQSRE
jgi:hypothetical protein